MLEELITDINNFNEKQVDNDVINENKTYFSIYNNKINQPFHKFWFTLSNCKYFTNYNDYSTIRFALNNKSNSVQKFIDFIKKLSEYLKKLFEKTFDSVTVDLPWKEFNNYPFLLSFYTNNEIIFVDSNKNNLEFDKLDNTFSYSILFEVKNLKIIKTQLDSEIMYTLKYNLSILMIQQEPQLDLKSYLLNKITSKHSDSNPDNLSQNSSFNSKPSLPFLSQLSSVNLKSDLEARNESNSQSKSISGAPKGLIDLKELLEVKSKLIKVNVEQDKNVTNSDDNKSGKSNTNLENALVEQKNQLKKVKTKEKTLFKQLKSKKKKSKNKESDEKNEVMEINTLDNNLELDLELERELEKELKTSVPESKIIKNKSDIEEFEKKKSKKNKKSKNKINEDMDLEKELELLG